MKNTDAIKPYDWIEAENTKQKTEQVKVEEIDDDERSTKEEKKSEENENFFQVNAFHHVGQIVDIIQIHWGQTPQQTLTNRQRNKGPESIKWKITPKCASSDSKEGNLKLKCNR